MINCNYILLFFLFNKQNKFSKLYNTLLILVNIPIIIFVVFKDKEYHIKLYLLKFLN